MGARRQPALGRRPEQARRRRAGVSDSGPGRATDADEFTFLFIGTDFERKGGFDVVEAFDRMAGDHPAARLVLVGSDPWERNPTGVTTRG